MDAKPILERVANLLAQHHIEAVLIGNAAAALQGAPVTTVDLDFLIRKTPTTLRKLRALAKDLRATLLLPHYPVSGLHRISRDEDGLQLDFMTVIDGIRSFEGLRRRAGTVVLGDATLRVASLADIIKSKRAAGRPRDLAVLEILERALHEEETRDARTTARSPEEGK